MKANNSFVLLSLPIVIVFAFAGCGTTSSQSDYLADSYPYKYLGDCELLADVFQKPSDEAQPVLLWLHPGGLITGNRSWLSTEEMEFFVDAGYTVVAIDHRLAPEFKLADIVRDVQDAYVWIREQGPDLYGIDPSRIAIVGHSAGGYLALNAGAHLDPKPSALVSFYGYGDLSGDWVTQPGVYYTDRPQVTKEQASEIIEELNGCLPKDSEMDPRFDYYVYTRQNGIWALEVSGHNPKTDSTWFFQQDPIHNIDATYPPTMLLHGEADNDVPFEQSVLLSEALEEAGVEFEWITDPTWGHVFDAAGLDDPRVADAFEAVIVFLDSHLNSP